MSVTAWRALRTAATAAATNEPGSSGLPRSEVWLRKTRRGPLAILLPIPGVPIGSTLPYPTCRCCAVQHIGAGTDWRTTAGCEAARPARRHPYGFRNSGLVRYPDKHACPTGGGGQASDGLARAWLVRCAAVRRQNLRHESWVEYASLDRRMTFATVAHDDGVGEVRFHCTLILLGELFRIVQDIARC